MSNDNKNKNQKTGIKAIRDVIKHIRPRYFMMFIGLIAISASSLIDTYLLSLLKPLLDNGFSQGSLSSGTLKWLALIVFILMFLRGSLIFISKVYSTMVQASISADLRKVLFNNLIYKPVSFFNNTNSSFLVSKLVHDVGNLSNTIANTLTIIVRDGVSAISLIILMLYTSWRLTVIALVIAPGAFYAIRAISNSTRRLTKRMSDDNADVFKEADELISYHCEIISNNAQKWKRDLIYKSIDRVAANSIKSTVLNNMSSTVILMVVAISLALILLILSFNTFNGGITAGEFAVIFSSLFSIINPLRSLISTFNSVNSSFVSSAILLEFLDSELENNKGSYIPESIKGHYEFKNVKFKYDKNDLNYAINNISLSLPAGKTYALVGKSGSGKSTFISLISRLYEVSEGKILLDGVNINDYELRNMRNNISEISQNVLLFNDSIYNNIVYNQIDRYSREEVIKAAEQAGILEFTDNMDNGIDSVIGEKGEGLSGGQKQRISIARAILRKSPILILDEATSALDNISESKIKKTIEGLRQGRTIFIVAHRLSTIESADKILVVENGQIYESGSHKELIAKQGKYYTLYNMQFNK